MEMRYANSPNEIKKYDTERLRKEFLMKDLFVEGEIKMIYSHHDRMVIGAAVPKSGPLQLDALDNLKTDYFLQRREIGIINTGPTGRIVVDGKEFILSKRDCLYIGKGKQHVAFQSNDNSNPAQFYFVSALAHQKYPTRKLAIEQATPNRLGSNNESNKRTIYQFIHEDGIQSCQLMMGMTMLEPGNIWNTMPAHLHDRRSEVYLYVDMDHPDTRVFHFMGEQQETRHLVVQNRQGVISPSWSIHSGAGTNNYTFIWAMAGENYSFTDMDGVDMKNLK